MMSFEGLMLVLRMDTAINVYTVQDGRFVFYGYLPVLIRTARTWLADMGYERAVSVEPDDGVSGLYQPVNQGPVPGEISQVPATNNRPNQRKQ